MRLAARARLAPLDEGATIAAAEGVPLTVLDEALGHGGGPLRLKPDCVLAPRAGAPARNAQGSGAETLAVPGYGAAQGAPVTTGAKET